jgi:hypothetical protein
MTNPLHFDPDLIFFFYLFIYIGKLKLYISAATRRPLREP